MSNTRFQIKRSATNSTIPALFQGELAYSANGTGAGVANPGNSGILFIGHPTSNAAVPVGGVMTMGTLTANQILSTNSTSGINQLICSNLSVNYVSLPSGYGGAGQVLASNGTSNAYWITLGGGSGTVTSISLGNGLTSTQSPLTTTGTMSVNAGASLAFTSGALGVNAAATSGLVANATGLWAKAGNGVAVDAGGINVLTPASSGLLSNTTGTWAVVNTAQLVLAAGGITHNAAGVVTLQDLTCSGNLTVSGTLTSLNATDLQIKDNMIQLAANQSGQAGTFLTGDAVDAGLYYQIGNSSSNACFSGFTRFKNALGSSNTQPYFKIWAGNVAPTATTITASNTGYLESFLVPYGAGGAFVANGTNIAITPSASVSVALSANSLSLTTTRLAVSNVASGSDGDILQSNSTATYWSSIDCGTF